MATERERQFSELSSVLRIGPAVNFEKIEMTPPSQQPGGQSVPDAANNTVRPINLHMARQVGPNLQQDARDIGANSDVKFACGKLTDMVGEGIQSIFGGLKSKEPEMPQDNPQFSMSQQQPAYQFKPTPFGV